MIPIRVDIQELDPWPKVIHELPQRPRRDGPVMWRVLSVELGVHRHRNLEGQVMRGCEAVPEDDAYDQTALRAVAILDCNIAAVDEGLPVCITRGLGTRTTSEEGDQCLATKVSLLAPILRNMDGCTHPDEQGTVESLAKLAAALVLVPREELVRGEPDARVGRLGRIESRQNKLYKSEIRRIAKMSNCSISPSPCVLPQTRRR